MATTKRRNSSFVFYFFLLFLLFSAAAVTEAEGQHGGFKNRNWKKGERERKKDSQKKLRGVLKGSNHDPDNLFPRHRDRKEKDFLTGVLLTVAGAEDIGSETHMIERPWGSAHAERVGLTWPDFDPIDKLITQLGGDFGDGKRMASEGDQGPYYSIIVVQSGGSGLDGTRIIVKLTVRPPDGK
ncbi:hypothetical protein EAH_00065280 [Eimeria acervulina]|uniref:Uncharacterized protein n=1 Tax=Eimeria acervulina TaxID=5801 RepID=U6GPN2_EIMAC|nr:hypothetical protein EAH_00065280 [Eimeria acervulina]CDI82181.1 hypothetical protein EAH_00065280 [Eimeria acervulina]